MRISFFILILFTLSAFSAPVYEVVKVEKLLNAQNQTDRILIEVKVSIGADSEKGIGYVKPSDVAAADADKTKIEELAVLLAAQLQKRLEARLSIAKRVTVDPATIIIDPVKVEEEKVKIESK